MKTDADRRHQTHSIEFLSFNLTDMLVLSSIPFDTYHAGLLGRLEGCEGVNRIVFD